MCSGKQKHTLSALDVMEAGNTESAVDLDDLKLLEVNLTPDPCYRPEFHG